MEADVSEHSVISSAAAENVWLLMGKEYRISRSIRLQWFFQHLNTVVSRKSDEDIVNSCEELEVLSVLQSLKNPDILEDADIALMITPTTKLSFVARQYRFVFCIDMSASLATVDTETGNVLFDDMFIILQNAFTGLVQPFCIPGSSLVLKPRLHVTVLAHTYIHATKCQVLVQGYCVNEWNVKYFLCQLKRKLQVLERSVADEITRRNMEELLNDEKASIKRSETSLFYILRDSLFALQLLPDGASAAIVVVTDGVFQFDNANVADALLQSVRHLAAVCSFLQVGSGYRRASVEFGYVPHCALMQFIATATSGAYLARCPRVEKLKDYEMNLYHKALFCWNFQRDIDRDKIDSYQGSSKSALYLSSWADYSSYSSVLTPHKDISATLPPQPLQTANYSEDELQTKIASILTLRSREGYITDGVRITQGKIGEDKGSQIEIKLVLPWKEHVLIEYIAKAPWPFDSSRNVTHVMVKVSGPYEFLVDITSTKPKNHRPLRKTVLKKFEQTMKGLELSDHLLVELQRFSTFPHASRIPDTIAKGTPLFCMNATSGTPILALQYGSKTKKSSKSPESLFANYWKPVVTMDTRTWSKWFHCHRISILLEHDRPITKGLMLPTSSDHYSTIHCRAALNAFNRFLKEWCSFILLENHSYVKFMTRPGENMPYTFCLLRLIYKGLCIELRPAFLGGTPGRDRSQVVEDLKVELCKLKTNLTKVTNKEDISLESQAKLTIKESPCIIFMTKQFQRILVKYDSLPDEIRDSNLDQTKAEPVANVTNQQDLLHRTPGNMLSQYLFNQRWIWEMGPSVDVGLDEKSVSQMLEIIIMQRLHEGFHFCNSNKRIITLVREVQVVVDSSEDNMSNCSVIQYVLFPPHTQLFMKNDIHDDSIESDGLQEVDGPLQMVVEIWVEPQMGTIDVTNCPLDYIHGVEYNKVSEKMFAVDAQIVKEFSSYMLIHKACVDKSIVNELPMEETPYPEIPTNVFKSSSSLKIPFLFEILPLLKKSRLVVSMYPLMKDLEQVDLPASSANQNDVLLVYLCKTLERMNDHKIFLHSKECKGINEYIRHRCTENNMSIWNQETNAPIFKQHDAEVEINYHCYLKSFGSSLILVFTPVSIQDLNLLLEPPKDEQVTDRSVLPGEKVGSPEMVRRNHIPFFIFECDYQIIQSIPAQFAHNEKDVMQDYTQALSESALTPRHLNQKLPDDRSKEIAMYCQALYDHFFWALVSGVYNCLQSGYVLDPEDVELAIELVCEESIQEIDITNFIRTICGHYRSQTLVSDICVQDDVFPDRLSPALFLPQDKSLSRLKKRSSSGSSSSLRGSKNSLKSKTKCDNLPMQEDIQAQFLEILEQNFQNVPNDPFYMFFSGGDKDCEIEIEADDGTSSSARSSISQSDPSFDEENMSTSGPESDNALDDAESVSHFNSDSITEQRPMFLHLTCSCHYKSSYGNAIRPISVTTLPTCLADILNKLEDSGLGIDPYSSSLSITLDLICLTQPSEPEEGYDWNAPKDITLKRHDSIDSFYSALSQGSERMRRQRLFSQVSQGESYTRTDVSDALDVLPVPQRQAVEKTVADINWLLEDEIASALRLQGPVTEENLDKVAKHVQNSKDFENCIFERRYFMFVTGIEKANDHCLPLFIWELESAKLDRYKLSRVGKYYCVVLPPNEDESDAESMVMDDKKPFSEVKERAKKMRKGLGHRRSQSDFSANRQHTLQRVELNDAMSVSKSKSLPSSLYLFANQELSSFGREDQDPSQIKSRLAFKESSSLRSGSSASVDVEDEGLFIRRCVSYSETDKEIEMNKRRRFSMPNMHIHSETGYSEDSSSGSDEFSESEGIPDMLVPPKHGATDFEEYIHLQPHPHFWLFTHIREESVDVYLHRRRSETLKHMDHHKGVYNRLLEAMDQICKIVNQRILLEHLYSKNICHNLLLAEDDEHAWDTSENGHDEIVYVKGAEKPNMPFGVVVHGEYKFQPGYFECDMVWQKNIPIHNRLTAITMVGGISKGLGAVRNVLNQFHVSNRPNLFVIKESETKNVFYFRVNEGAQNNSSISPLPDDDHLFTPVHEDLMQSRASSMASLVLKTDDHFGRFEFERQESYHSGQFMLKNDDRASTSEASVAHHSTQAYINFSVFGIRDPGKEIKFDMIQLITKKLDATTLDLINQSLARNPKCKLTPQDVEFIQPTGHLPSRVIHLCISNFAVRFLHGVMFYLQQHLLQKYNTPRFTVSDEELHFKDYTTFKQSVLTANPISSNDLFLYNRRESSGNDGIGIVYMCLVDQDGDKIVAQPFYPSLSYDSSNVVEYLSILDQICCVKKVTDVEDHNSTLCRNMLIEFKIWERGNIDIDALEKELIRNVQYSLCDAFLEYHLFCTPISFIPKLLQTSVHSSRLGSIARKSSKNQQTIHSSGSSNATTPKLIKSHLPVKKFFSEPTTPSDLRSESPVVEGRTKDDLSFLKDVQGDSPQDVEKRRILFSQSKTEGAGNMNKRESPMILTQQKRESPGILKNKLSREASPLLRKCSTSSRSSSVHSEADLNVPLPRTDEQSPDPTKQPKTITMSELNQMKLPVGTSYVMLTDAEVQESLKAVEGESEKKTTWQEIEIQRRLELDKRKEKRRHEHGVIGDLHSNYFECAPSLFDKIIEHGDQTVHKQVGHLTHQYSVEAVMQEFIKEIHEKSPDISPKVFKYTTTNVDDVELATYQKYHERVAVKTEQADESSVDMMQNHHISVIPKENFKYIVIGHNSHKWLQSMGTNEADLSDDEEGKTSIEEQSKQKFKPLLLPHSGSSQERRKLQELPPPCCISHTFVPRQKFFMAVFESKTITLYTYNFASDVIIDKQFKRLYAWHNVRSHLNACMFIQKLGLFHHKHFVRDCPGNDDPDVASFASSSSRNHLLPLMKAVSPKAKDKNKHDLEQATPGVKIPEFDQVFRDTSPSRTIQETKFYHFKDLVKRQACQYQRAKSLKSHCGGVYFNDFVRWDAIMYCNHCNNECIEMTSSKHVCKQILIAYKEARLKEIFDGWKQEGAHVTVTEERFHLLKRHSRFFHYCDAPIMFKIYDDDDDAKKTNDTEEANETGGSSDETDGSRIKHTDKEDWFEELKWIFVQKYIQYLQTLGLCLVQISNKTATNVSNRTTSHKSKGSTRMSRTSNRSSDGKDFAIPEVRPSSYYLQKTTGGGIILMEVLIKKNYLCYRILAFNSSSLSACFVSMKDQKYFIEDCNKFKDLSHLQSFSYDFHVQQIQDHLAGRHSVFRKGYPVHKLMALIIQIYPSAPKFCRCKLASGSISLPCTPGISNETLFKYLISNCNTYKLAKIFVGSKEDFDLADPKDFILTCHYNAEKQPMQFAEGWRTRRDVTEYDGYVAAHFEMPESDGVITLPFFLVLRNKKEFYPRRDMMSSVSSLKRRQRTQSGMEQSTLTEGEIVKQKVRVRFSGPNESQESAITHVQSTGSLKRMPSWSQAIATGDGSLNSLRSSGSDTSLMSSRNAFSPRSPGRPSHLNISPVSGSPESEIMIGDATTRSVTSTQESYLLHEQKFLMQEVYHVRDKLNKKVGKCLSHCWRDLLWLELLTDDSSTKKAKKKSNSQTHQDMLSCTLIKYIDEWKADLSMHLLPERQHLPITFSTLKKLIELVTRYRISDVDRRISDAFMYVQPGTQQQVIRSLQLKFDAWCRHYVSEDGEVTYLCVISPGDLNMFFLVEANETTGCMDFSAIYRCQPLAKPFECKEEECLKTLEKNSRNHIEHVVSCLCFNLWQQMIPL